MDREVLEPLSADRARIDRIVARLHSTADLTERADLGAELSRAVSRYEDTVERAVVPRMAGILGGERVVDLARTRDALRDAMTVVHERTMHIDPRNVHVSDPEGFERALDEVVGRLERHLPEEDRAIAALVERAPEETRGALASDVAKAARNASEKPHPPRTAVGRFVANANVKLDHTIEDVATPHHPGAETIDERRGDREEPGEETSERGWNR